MSFGGGGAGAEGGAGMSLAGDFGAEGSSPLAGSGASGGGGAGGGLLGGLGGILGAIGKDPNTYKELAGLVAKIAAAADHGNNLSPGTKQMISQAIQQGHQRPDRKITPYTGDITDYITPGMAASTLSELGISPRRSML